MEKKPTVKVRALTTFWAEQPLGYVESGEVVEMDEHLADVRAGQGLVEHVGAKKDAKDAKKPEK